MRHAVTIDLEDWHQLVRRRVTGAPTPPTRNVITDVHRALDLLDEAHVRATFFVMGEVAAEFPELIREVAARGHEIGSHTYAHRLITSQSRDVFRDDVDRSRKQLQDLTGQPVLGFRAPEFSVSHLGHWCFDVLAELGFAYDSSVVPAPGVRYGIPEASASPFRMDTDHGPLWEFPLPIWRVGGQLRPVGGGSWFRVVPRTVIRSAVKGYDIDERPAVLYFHPYEFHQGWLWLDDMSLKQRMTRGHIQLTLLHNLRTSAVARHLRALVSEFSFAPLGDSLARLAQPA